MAVDVNFSTSSKNLNIKDLSVSTIFFLIVIVVFGLTTLPKEAYQSTFDELHGAWKCGQTLSLGVFDISFQSKLNLRRN